MDRRRFLTTLAGAAVAGATLSLAPGQAFALAEDEAKAFVREAVDELLSLAVEPGPVADKADRFQAIMEKRAAIPQIARFAAGRVWRDMSEAQQDRYVDAFAHYISHIYAGRFEEYSGQQVEIGGVSDEGKRGLLVSSRVVGGGQEPVKVDWLVSDRPGRTVVADIVIEGVSMLIQQREEIAGLYAQRGNDPDRLIDYLGNVGVQA